MRRIYSLIIITLGLMVAQSYTASAQQELIECANKYKSCILAGTAPQPFQELRNNSIRWYHERPAISTGYYFVTDQSTTADELKPATTDFVDTTVNTAQWVKIVNGPRQYAPDFWESSENEEGGYWFFRNPASNNGNVFDQDRFAVIDSSDDAIAGPMPIGLPGGFRFNGLRMDSFYVSTNGLVALSNRRYKYDQDGNREREAGGTAYDENSIDWYLSSSLGRNRVGSGLEGEDSTPDDFGWRYIALGNNALGAQSGIRNRTGNFANLQYNAPVIAPLWGDNHLSSYAATDETIDPLGKVWYYRDSTKTKLYVYFMNIAPKGAKASPCGNYNAPANLRVGDGLYVSANVQVIMDALDESVTIVYRSFNGLANVTNFCQVPSEKVFLYNTTAGVRGFARHQNYNRQASEQVAIPEYEQFTLHWRFEANNAAPYPQNQQTVKYKQWSNTLRVVDIQYRVRDPKLDPFNNDLSFKEEVRSSEVANYELLAGEERIGAIQPVAILQNLSNDIQGPEGYNYVPQDLEFEARFRIVNAASRRIVYQKTVAIDSTCMSLALADRVDCTGDRDALVRFSEVTFDGRDYEATHYNNPVDDPTGTLHFPGDGSNTPSGNPMNGVLPYGMVQVFFPPFEPNEFQDNHIGRLNAFVIAVPETPQGESFGDEWPFDDTTSVPLFVMRRLESFYDDVTEFHLIDGVMMPSVLKWVNVDAEAVNGELISKHPLPPRGSWNPTYEENWNDEYIEQLKQRRLDSPVIKMNRRTLAGMEPATAPGGDEIRTFPIDMRGKLNSVISFGIQRTAYDDNWQRGYSDNRLIGPEPRVAYNNNPLDLYDNDNRAASRNPDEIVMEMANNYVDDELERLYHVTNIEDDQWRLHFRRYGQDPVENMPAFGLYGAGGYRIGFLEEDKDSALQMSTNFEQHGLRPNLYDDGIDFEFTKYYVPIPDTTINYDYGVAQNFRFRFRVMATNDQKCITCIPDDDDDFYLDNIRILFEDAEATDIEVTAVKIRWPYTQVPATQASEIPVFATVVNNTSTDAPTYEIKVNIYKEGYGPDADLNGVPDSAVYCSRKTIAAHNARVNFEVAMPRFNARRTGPGNYIMQAIVSLPLGSDKDERNDTTWSEFELEFGDAFAYDQVDNPSNDVPGETNITGRGLTTFGYATGGGFPFGYAWDFVTNGAGETAGTGSGQIAMKFKLEVADTIKGYKAYFGTLNQAPDFIQFAIYDGDVLPQTPIAGTIVDKMRGVDDSRNQERFFGEYVHYDLGIGRVLEPGTYWMVIAQLGETGLELGATSYRGGQRTTHVHIQPPQPVGVAGITLNVHKEFRVRGGDNVRYVNDNYFALENSKGSGAWQQFSPSEGNGAYARLHHVGWTPVDFTTFTLTRGFWIPLIRPYFGEKGFETNPVFVDCEVIPVELTYFKGAVRNEGIELFWETSSEENNRGFYIERKLHTEEEEDAWRQITFVDAYGTGTSSSAQYYNYTDNEIVPNVTYDYRLRQVDIDGTQNCNTDQVVTLTYEAALDLAILPNVPNPFNESTEIRFFIPELNNQISVEILDMFGNVVKSFNNASIFTGENSLSWDGTDATGSKVASGNYIVRVSNGDDVKTHKISFYK